MVVLSVYLARSKAGSGVMVGCGVSVGAAGVSVTGKVRKTDSVGVGASAGCSAEQAETKRMMARIETMVFLWFCMEAILP